MNPEASAFAAVSGGTSATSGPSRDPRQQNRHPEILFTREEVWHQGSSIHQSVLQKVAFRPLHPSIEGQRFLTPRGSPWPVLTRPGCGFSGNWRYPSLDVIQTTVDGDEHTFEAFSESTERRTMFNRLLNEAVQHESQREATRTILEKHFPRMWGAIVKHITNLLSRGDNWPDAITWDAHILRGRPHMTLQLVWTRINRENDIGKQAREIDLLEFKDVHSVMVPTWVPGWSTAPPTTSAPMNQPGGVNSQGFQSQPFYPHAGAR